MIDVLRASTTIISALAHGAAGVRPVPTVDQARALAAAVPGRSDGGRILLGGERGGLRIDGFDLGNSPLEYSSGRVAGRRIVITTTNGTAALEAALPATEVLIGAIVNRTAAAARARSLAAAHGTTSIHLVCAGTDGEITEEDLLAAGAILDAAGHLPGGDRDTLDVAATAALARFRGVVLGAADHSNAGRSAAIAAAFAGSRGGRHLVAIGMQADLPAAAAIDSLAIVPRLTRGASGQGAEAGWLQAAAGESV